LQIDAFIKRRKANIKHFQTGRDLLAQRDSAILCVKDFRSACWQKYDDNCHCCHAVPDDNLNVMNARINTTARRGLLKTTAKLALLLGIMLSGLDELSASPTPADSSSSSESGQPLVKTKPLKPPAEGSIPVAFVISEGAQMIDFAGPWEVFQDVMIPGGPEHPFRLYTVSESTSPIRASGGMKIIPDYDFKNAPAPKVIVIPAQSEPTEATLEWIRRSTKKTDVTMSVCTGAFLLAKAGLLSGKSATTYHGAFRTFAAQFPDIHLKRGARFVEDGNVATAGGLSSGIDLALRVVERYFGRDIAQRTAYDLEYQGQGWTDPDSNQIYAEERVSTNEHPLCPVCGMDVDPATAPKSVFKGTTYYFCSDDEKKTFDAAPDKFVASGKKSL
jgi:putative intracellular protease/amidase/YHS domain-containing protein